MEHKEKKNLKKGIKIVLNVFRYFTVILVTAYLFILFLSTLDSNDFWFSMIIVSTIVAVYTLYFVIIPTIALWVYSFIISVKSISVWKDASLNNRILFFLHLFDFVLVVGVILMSARPAFHCDPFMMEKQYEKNWKEMRAIVKDTRSMLPDSSSLRLEFKEGFKSEGMQSKSDLLDATQMQEIEKRLDRVGCIGIWVRNYNDPGYAELNFRRIGMGMYSFRLYDHKLTAEECDSLNKDCQYIVCNDSTVLEYGGGAFGSQCFPNKENYIRKKHNRNK